MMVFPCMSQGLVKSGSCRGSVGKRRRPRPINRHASTKAAGFWGPQCSALDLWLRLEAKPESAMGPGATVGVLGTGVPRLACLRPAAWLHQWPSTDPREGLECLLVKMGRTRPLEEPHRGSQAGKSGDPHSQNADSSPRAQGALRLGFKATYYNPMMCCHPMMF